MSTMSQPGEICGYRWRSSETMAIVCVTIALISDTFLYSFIVPILSYMLQERLHVEVAHVQYYISAVLAVFGLVCMIAGPIVGHSSDKSPDRRTPMLLALAVSMVGTFLLASARSISIFFLGRAMQAVDGSVSWVVGLATLADRVDEEDIGKVMGIVMSLQTGGPILGPMVSGFLFDAVGYWPTWTAPLVMLLVDFIARWLMVEVRLQKSVTMSSSDDQAETETSALVSGVDTQYQSIENEHSENVGDRAGPFAFYLDILSDGRALTSICISSISMIFISSLDTTLPLHVQDVFGLGPSTSGLIFFCYSASSLVLTPVSGWLYDRVGPKHPLTVSLLAQVLFTWFLGVPRSDHIPWADSTTAAAAIFISAIVGVGGTSPFLSGIGILGLTSVVKERQAEKPNVFGPHGGFGRAYSLNEVLSTGAMMAGPIISGALHKAIGYYYMNVVFAAMFLPLPFCAFWYLSDVRVNNRVRPQ